MSTTAAAAPAALPPSIPTSGEVKLVTGKKGKGKKGRRDSVENASAPPAKRQRPEAEVIYGVTLSHTDKAPQVVLSGKRLTATSEKGYRGVRATHSVSDGKWCFEVQMKEPVAPKYGLPPSYAPHVRLGWCTDKADLQTPLGFDGHGFSYRDISDRAHPAPDKREESHDAGSAFHTARGRVYGERYGPGDTIGCYISLPSQTEGAEGEAGEQQAGTIHPASLTASAQPLKAGDEPPRRCKGSTISFTKNGKHLGQAFEELPEGNYFPSISLYMGATATFNFGPDFEHPAPPELQGYLLMSNLAPAAMLAPTPEGGTETKQEQGGGDQAAAVVGEPPVKVEAVEVKAEEGAGNAEASV